MFQGNILLWNCRGIVNWETQRALINIVQARRPSVIFLSETLAQRPLIESLVGKLGFHDSFCVEAGKDSQGVAILWKDDTNVKVRSYSPHHIDAIIGKDGEEPWRFTGIYGFAGRDVRSRTWNLIESLALQNCPLPWLMAGDFNEIMCQADKSGGPRRCSAAMTKFRSTMTACGFIDMGFVGGRYTWSNKFTKERLDRGFQTAKWRSCFPYSRVITLNPSDSDHNPLLVEVRADRSGQVKWCKRYRFEEGWYGRSECTDIIRQEWALPTTGNALGQLSSKIKGSGEKLMVWHKEDLNQQRVEMRVTEEKLNDLMKAPYSPEQYEEQKNLHVKLSGLLAIQEKYWRQRSRVTWLKDGDRNSAFFHRRASNRKSRNTIKGLNDAGGVWQTDPTKIEEQLLRYFQSVFSAEEVDEEAISCVMASTPMKVTREMNDELLKPYSEEEIKTAAFQMHPSKSPGPDGTTPFFFQKYWSTVSNDVCIAVKGLLEKGEMWEEANHTHICLIPKVPEPKEASQFRPIALCNVICRIASKVLANRLKLCLPSIISPLQSAYVPGRLISDNTLIATEVAHFMHGLRSQVEGFFSLKLDISKAYDRLEWRFLQAILTKLGFADRWIQIIMTCIQTVSYSIIVRGEVTERIVPTRGIRQGDPLSLYLFILCSEGLSALISHAVRSRRVFGLKMCPQAPVLHHLFFADDSVIYGAATADECRAFRTILNIYERASGQKVNLQKSSVVFSNNVSEEVKDSLAGILEVQCVQEHDRYLGLPMRVGRSKTAIFSYIKERLEKKLLGWKAKILSAAGKEVLIKAVAQTMPLYAMNCYCLPKSLCDDIHQLCASFFWGDTVDKKKIHWRSWEKLCLTKQEGGMGFKNIYAYNLAMLAKQGWRLLTNPDSLIAQLLKARYYPQCSFWEAELGDAPSFSWRSILKGRPILLGGVQWRVGDGKQIRVWQDKWIPNCPQYLVQAPPNCEIQRVEDLIDGNSRQWKRELIQSLFLPAVAEKILCIPISRRSRVDKLSWSLEKYGSYSVKTAYWLARSQVMPNSLASSSSGDLYRELWRKLWKACVPGKVHITIWRACNALLPTMDRLATKGFPGELHCVVCQHRLEDTMHALCLCPLVAQILSEAPFKLGAFLSPHWSFKDWMVDVALKLPINLFEKLLMVMWSCWKNRNNILWSNKGISADAIVFGSFSWLEEFHKARKPEKPNSAVPRRVKTWQPPSNDQVKLNVDGSFLSQFSRGGTGGVIRDSQGQFVAAFARPVQDVASPKQVELIAIREGIKLLTTLRISKVIIETDCSEAIAAVKAQNFDGMVEAGLVDDIRELLRDYPEASINHVGRKCNRVAHRLAALAYEDGLGTIWSLRPPECIQDALQLDCNSTA